MKRIKSGVTVLIAAILLSGCGINIFGAGEEPPDELDTEVREKYYEDFVSLYEDYEENVREYGKFTDENNELIEFEEESKESNPVMEAAAEGRKNAENGGEMILNEDEDELVSDIIMLSSLKSFDFYTEDLKAAFWENQPQFEKGNVEQASIDVEQKVIDALDLDKEPITAVIAEEAEAVEQKEQETEQQQAQEEQKKQEEAEEQTVQEEEAQDKNEEKKASNNGESLISGTPSDGSNYEPEYVDEMEWQSCMEAYSTEECISHDQYYAYGEGREELLEAGDPDNEAMDTYYRAEEGWDSDNGLYEQAYAAAVEVAKDFYSGRNEIKDLHFPYFEDLRVEEIFRDKEGNIITNSTVGIEKGIDEEVEYKNYRVKMTTDLEYVYFYIADESYYEELSGQY